MHPTIDLLDTGEIVLSRDVEGPVLEAAWRIAAEDARAAYAAWRARPSRLAHAVYLAAVDQADAAAATLAREAVTAADRAHAQRPLAA